MRPDALGLWWRDEPVVKVRKEPPPKRTPPEPVWLRDDYLPGLEESLRFPVHVMSEAELWKAYANREHLLFDVEAYWNYFLVSFRSYSTGSVVYFEMGLDGSMQLEKLAWIMRSFTLVGFNSEGYDVPMIELAYAGKTCQQIKTATNQIIKEDWRAYDTLKAQKVKPCFNKANHIDLIEVAPLQASLKIYGGRLHVPKMQDLPFHPERYLTSEQMAIVRWYNINDLTQTAFLYESLTEQIKLREAMSMEYGLDLRSHSDAQVAESVIGHEFKKLNGMRPVKPLIEPGTTYYYRVPDFVQFETPLMNSALDIVRRAKFIVEEHGGVGLPKEIAKLKIPIADNAYTMGIGGLHSTETHVAVVAGTDAVIMDRDVTSYYPQIILNQGLYPSHLGPNFLRIYKRIVDRRLEAKVLGDKSKAESLKITVNGSFGKLGSKYSILYSPDLLIQVTMTGQLAILMLIECLELRGIRVISANTDGVVILCPKERQQELLWYIKAWEKQTNFQTEETLYSAYYGRDVNNYIAVKMPDAEGVTETKAKGAYANPWNNPKNDSKQAILRLHKNPVNTICIEAVENLLTKNVPIQDTIRKCTDICKFISVRKVKGGAVKDGQYLGSSIRWYYATEQTGEMVYASSGNKVPRSDGAKPLLELPTEFPSDIDFAWYEADTQKILKDIAYLD